MAFITPGTKRFLIKKGGDLLVNPAPRVETRGFLQGNILMHPYIPVLKSRALRGAA